MTEEVENTKCDPDDIVNKMQILSHLKGLQSTLGDEKFKSEMPELAELGEKLTERIESQETILRETLERCSLPPEGEEAPHEENA